MDAVPLVDTYKRYKFGTKKVIRWLFESAQRCEKTNVRPSPHRETPKIRADDLITFANRIAACKDPKIDITLEILDVTKDVIKGRQLCADWYAALDSKSQQPESDSDISHRYFLDVLIQVYEILRKEHKARRPKRKKKMPELPTDTDDLANLYLHLGLEETVEDECPELDTAASRSSKKKDKKEFGNTIEIDDAQHQREEMVFAVWALLEDLRQVRRYSRQVMLQFLDGKVSFITMAKAATDAINICIIVGIQLRKEYPHLHSFDRIIELLGVDWFYSVVQAAKYDCSSVRASGWQDVDLPYERIFVDGWTALAMMRKTIYYGSKLADEKHWPFTGKCYFPLKDTRLHPFADVLIAARGELWLLLDESDNKLDKNGRRIVESALDQFCCCLLNCFQTGECSTGFIAATAVYCDLFDVLNGKMDIGHIICTPIASQRTREAEHALRQFERASPPDISAHLPSTIDTLLKMKEDAFSVCCDEHGNEGWLFLRDRKNSLFVPNKLLLLLPLFPAELARQTCENLADIGLVLGNYKHTILGLAHLHRASKMSGQTGPWPDLDFLVEAQCPQSQELGSVPFLRQGEASVDLVFKEYAMALGFSLNEVRKVKKPNIDSRGKYDNAKRLQGAMRMGKARQASYNQHDRLGMGHEITDLRDMYDAIRQYHAIRGIQDPKLANQWNETKKLSPAQVLQVLHEICIYEEQYAHFDYFGFFLLCLQDLSSIRKSLGNVPESCPPFAFHLIYAILRDSSAMPSPLNKAAKIISSRIAETGSKFLDGSRAAIQHQIQASQSFLAGPFPSSDAFGNMTKPFRVDWKSVQEQVAKRNAQINRLEKHWSSQPFAEPTAADRQLLILQARASGLFSPVELVMVDDKPIMRDEAGILVMVHGKPIMRYEAGIKESDSKPPSEENEDDMAWAKKGLRKKFVF